MIILFLLLYSKIDAVQVDGAIAVKDESTIILKEFIDVIVNVKIHNDLLTSDDHDCLKNKLNAKDETFNQIVKSINEVKQKEFTHLLQSMGIEVEDEMGMIKSFMNCKNIKQICGEEAFSCCADKYVESEKAFCYNHLSHPELVTVNSDSVIYSSECYRQKLSEKYNFAITKYMNYTENVKTKNEVGEFRTKLQSNGHEGFVRTDVLNPVIDKNLSTVGILEEEPNSYNVTFEFNPKWKQNKGYRTITLVVGRRRDLKMSHPKHYVQNLNIQVSADVGTCKFINKRFLREMEAKLDAEYIVFDCNYNRIGKLSISITIKEMTVRLHEILIFRAEPTVLLKKLEDVISERRRKTHFLHDQEEVIVLPTIQPTTKATIETKSTTETTTETKSSTETKTETKSTTGTKSTLSTKSPLDIVVTATVGNEWVTRRQQSSTDNNQKTTARPLNPLPPSQRMVTPETIIPKSPTVENIQTQNGQIDGSETVLPLNPPSVTRTTVAVVAPTFSHTRELNTPEVIFETDDEDVIGETEVPGIEGSGYLVYDDLESDSEYNKTYFSKNEYDSWNDYEAWNNSYEASGDYLQEELHRQGRSVSLFERISETVKYYIKGGHYTNWYNLEKFDAFSHTQTEIIEAVKANKQALLEFSTSEQKLLAAVCEQGVEFSKEILNLKASISLLDFKLVVINSIDSCRQGQIPLLMTEQLVNKICQAYNDKYSCEYFHQIKTMSCELIGLRVLTGEERQLDIQMKFKIPRTNGYEIWKLLPVLTPVTNEMLNFKLIQKEDLMNNKNQNFWDSITQNEPIENPTKNYYFYSKKLPKKVIIKNSYVGSTESDNKFISESDISESCVKYGEKSLMTSDCEAIFSTEKECVVTKMDAIRQLMISTEFQLKIYKNGVFMRTCTGVCFLKEGEFTLDCNNEIVQNKFKTLEVNVTIPIMKFDNSNTETLNKYLEKLNQEINETRTKLINDKHHDFLENISIEKPATKLLLLSIGVVFVLIIIIYGCYRIRKYIIAKVFQNANYISPEEVKKLTISSPL